MANTVTLKRSSVAGKIPQTTDLTFGEVALNFTDGRLYFRNSNNEIQFFDSGRKTEFLPPFAANESNFGSVTDESLYSFDLGKITSPNLFEFDLGTSQTDLSLFESDSINLGLINQSVNDSYNFGSVTGSVTSSFDLGSVVTDDFNVFESDFNLGSITGAVEDNYFLGNVSDPIILSYDLGNIVDNELVFPERFVLPTSTVSTLPVGIVGEMRFITDESNGPTPAFFDGTDWKRLSDNQPIS